MARKRGKGRLAQGPARAVRRTQPARPRRRRSRALPALAVLLVLGVVAAVVVGLAGRSSTPAVTAKPCTAPAPDPGRAPEAEAASSKLDAAFLATASSTQALFLTDLPQFEKGQLTATEMTARARAAGENFAFSRQRVSEVVLPSWAPGLQELFYQVDSLFVEAAQSLVLASQTEGLVRAELVKKSKRERRLADAVFDRARAVLRGAISETRNPNVDFRPPVALPDYRDIEEGPPFWTVPAPARVGAETATGTFDLARARCQPFPDWYPAGRAAAASVADRITKQPLALQVFVDGGNPSDLRTTSVGLTRDVFVATDTDLGRQPYPEGAVQESLVLRAALYAYEEMARSMNEATHVDGPLRNSLVDKAKRERLIGDQFFNWASDRLGENAGLPNVAEQPGLLFAKAPGSTYPPQLNGIDGPFDASHAAAATVTPTMPSLTPIPTGSPRP